MVILTDVTINAVELVCHRLRERDQAEVYCIRPHDNWYRLAHEAFAIISNQGRGRIAWWQGRPVGLCAFTERWPGVWDAWMFGTDELKNAAVDLVRWGRHEVRDILKHCNGHRCQADSMLGYDEAHRLLMALGARPEGPPMRGYGKHGESFQRFVWLRGQDDAVLEPGFVRADRVREVETA